MQKLWVMAALSVAMSACSSTSVVSRPPVGLDGIESDLRVFLNADCIASADGTSTRAFGVDAVAQLAVGLGSMLFKSLGQTFSDLGSPKLDHSMAIASGFIYKPLDADQRTKVAAARNSSTPADLTLALNPDARCIHVVREGFGTGPEIAKSSAPAEVKGYWKSIGLTSVPSFYALIGLETDTDRDAGSVFRGRLLALTAQRFERASARHSDRDYLLFLDFELPAKTRYYKVQAEAGSYVEQQGGVFARGGFKLPMVDLGEYLGPDRLKGLETGWMTAPGLNAAEGGAFNVFVDLVEVKRGDPFFADLGALFKSAPVVSAVETDLKAEFETEADRRARVTKQNQTQDAQIVLVRTLENDASALEVVLGNPNATPAARRDARRRAEDALRALEQKKALDGWLGSYPAELVGRAKALIDKAALQ